MGNANNRNAQQLDRYSGGKWSELMERVRRIQEEYEQGGLSEAAKHHKVDELYEARGSMKAAKDLIRLIKAEHQKGVEWGLERLLVAVRRLEDLPYVEPGERQDIERRITGIISLIDCGELDKAESEVRDIESNVEQLQRVSLEAEFASLLSGIGEMYQPMVQ